MTTVSRGCSAGAAGCCCACAGTTPAVSAATPPIASARETRRPELKVEVIGSPLGGSVETAARFFVCAGMLGHGVPKRKPSLQNRDVPGVRCEPLFVRYKPIDSGLDWHFAGTGV